jgi:hypothetical protein
MELWMANFLMLVLRAYDSIDHGTVDLAKLDLHRAIKEFVKPMLREHGYVAIVRKWKKKVNVIPVRFRGEILFYHITYSGVNVYKRSEIKLIRKVCE